MREHFNTYGLNAWLDTAAGKFYAAAHGGSRQSAADALMQDEENDRAWRRSVAARRAESQPGRFASVDDAMIATPDPVGGGVMLNGTVDDIVRMVRRVDTTMKVRNLGEAPVDGTPAQVLVDHGDGRYMPADTRPPWQR